VPAPLTFQSRRAQPSSGGAGSLFALVRGHSRGVARTYARRLDRVAQSSVRKGGDRPAEWVDIATLAAERTEKRPDATPRR
jgi:hypothetical protein